MRVVRLKSWKKNSSAADRSINLDRRVKVKRFHARARFVDLFNFTLGVALQGRSMEMCKIGWNFSLMIIEWDEKTGTRKKYTYTYVCRTIICVERVTVTINIIIVKSFDQ